MEPAFLLQLTLSGLAVGSVYALVALGFALIFATVRVVNFAQGEFVMLGALAGYTAHVSLGLPLLLAILAAGLLTVVAALATERLAVYPLRGVHSSIAWVLSTLAVGLMLKSGAAAVWGKVPLPFPAPFGTQRVVVGDLAFLPQEALTFALAVGTMLLLELLHRKTIFGKAMRAVAFNLDAAKLVGINVSSASLLAFSLSAGLAALAGILIAPISNASSEMGTLLGIKGFAAAAVGGLGTFQGALVGGLILGLVEVLAAGLLWPGFADVAAFLLLIVILLVRPTGLFGRPESPRA
jgi:branched-chain amino acid transport system permease protein